jgi:DNA replication regulator DPB11
MGAQHKLDLTIDVTHLVVGDANTAKYKYVAKERPDVHVLSPQWIEAARELWMEGGDVNMSALQEEFRYPTLAGFQVCLTGFTNNDERTTIATTIQQHGADYHGDLTKQITHLIVAEPQGAKYNAAKDWGVITVSLKWLEDSVRRGMALDTSLYDPTIPLRDQGQGAYRTEVKSRQSLGKRQREGESRADNADAGPRKLRRAASSRLQNHSQDVWQGISVRDSLIQPLNVDQWTATDAESQHTLGHEPSKNNENIEKADDSIVAPDTTTTQAQGIFSGWHVQIRGFDDIKSERIIGFLRPHGAKIAKTMADLEEASSDPFFQYRCVLIPHDRPSQEPRLDDLPAGTIIATEWWLERCLHYKQAFDPAENVLSQPMWDVLTDELAGMTISTTGFSGLEFRQHGEAIKLTGATYEDKLLPTLSVLVSGTGKMKREKAFYAVKHNIPVVSADWLWETLRTKRKAPIEQYKINLPSLGLEDFGGESTANSPAPSVSGRGPSEQITR